MSYANVGKTGLLAAVVAEDKAVADNELDMTDVKIVATKDTFR
ncbi:MAG TPA: hypothetical protein VK364_06145 [Hymenobacter sp.]|nr:hypothetical protein [Hymenobacter sp.]